MRFLHLRDVYSLYKHQGKPVFPYDSILLCVFQI